MQQAGPLINSMIPPTFITKDNFTGETLASQNTDENVPGK